jgi:WD40 repeat protein
MVTVSYGDGSIRIFEGLVGKMHSRGGAQTGIEFLDSVDGVWEVHSVVSPIEKPDMGACICFDWKACEGETAILVAGYEGCCPQIYSYDVKHFTWTHRDELTPSDDAMSTVSDIAWAPQLGRPYDIVAVACGTCVNLWSISGPVDELDMHVIATLEHDAHVWQVGWNMTGNWLAASTDDNRVCLWRPDLAGEWLLLNVIQGLNKL